MDTDAAAPRRCSPASLLFAAWLVLPVAIVYCQAHLDRRIADRLAAMHTMSWPLLGWPHRLVDVLVTALLPVMLLCAYQLWRRKTPAWLGCTIDASAALTAVMALKTPLKALFGRTWPTTFFEGNPSYLEHGVYGFVPLSWQVAYWAFPSGHAAEITAITVAVAWYYPRAAWGMLLSLMVMADLVLLNYHWLSDVLGGALFGLTVALLVLRLQLPQRLQQQRQSRTSPVSD